MSSQGREDVVLRELFGRIGITNRYAVEFGARDGVRLSNTHTLRVKHGWQCLLLDREPQAPLVHWALLTRENINAVFATHEVPEAFDLLSIDVDGNDFHLWRALEGYRPRVVVIEYNARFGPSESVVMPYRADHRWDKTSYYGASAAALAKLGRQKGYSLVDVILGTNLVFVRDEALLPPAQNLGYPGDGGRPWEVY